MERPQIEVYKTAYSEQMAGKISVPFKILIDVCDYALNLESQLHQEREKRAQAEAENAKLLKEGTIAMNGLFLLSQSIIHSLGDCWKSIEDWMLTQAKEAANDSSNSDKYRE